jgi:hypothetical protein
MLAVSAERDLPAGTRLRFRAPGGGEAEVALGSGPLRRGQVARIPVPPQLCAGRAAGTRMQFQIQVATSDLQNAENVPSQNQASPFKIQTATSDLQNAENVPSQSQQSQFKIQSATSDLQNAESVRSMTLGC